MMLPMMRSAVLGVLAMALGCTGRSSSTPVPDSKVSAAPAAGVTRTYYVAAEEVAWDYAPTGMNQIKGLPFDEHARVFVEPSPTRIGKVYMKAVYREYTDETFATQKPRAAGEEHLGLLGPTLRGVVGDTLRVVFRNNTSIDVSMHPHGVLYDKRSEGAKYNDGTRDADRVDDVVPPGGTYVYEWTIPERAGPGPSDPSSVVWLYHSHVMSPRATNTGLIGTIVVTRPDMATPDARPRDVDRELTNLFMIMDENESFYAEANRKRYLTATVDPEDEDFRESNLMHAINGYVYGNLPGLIMNQGERVRWYLVALGTEVDLHTPHWHGTTVVWNGRRTDVVELLPASMAVADMVADNVGVWVYHCHVNDHIKAGMQALYAVGPLDGKSMASVPVPVQGVAVK